MVASARGQPARHYACPAHADLPQPLPGRVDRLPFWLEQAAPPRPPLTILRLITHAWRAQVDVLRGSHRANLALEPTAFHQTGSEGAHDRARTLGLR